MIGKGTRVARRSSSHSAPTPATAVAREGTTSSGSAAGRWSAVNAATPTSTSWRAAPYANRRRASSPATAASTSTPPITEPMRTRLSLLPKRAIAHSFIGVGVRSMTWEPTASTGDDAVFSSEATKWPAATPTRVARTPNRA